MKLTAQDVYMALADQLDNVYGYISENPIDLKSVTVEGVIDCEAIAEYLNAKGQNNER